MPKAQELKVMANEKTKNLKTLEFAEFNGSLIAHEGKTKELQDDDSNIGK